MTDTPIMVDINCTTGEVIERPYTAEELAQREIDIAEAKANEAARKAYEEKRQALKDSAKAKLVAGEPLTEEEASVLVI